MPGKKNKVMPERIPLIPGRKTSQCQGEHQLLPGKTNRLPAEEYTKRYQAGQQSDAGLRCRINNSDKGKVICWLPPDFLGYYKKNCIFRVKKTSDSTSVHTSHTNNPKIQQKIIK
jgi:hypothetical protein